MNEAERELDLKFTGDIKVTRRQSVYSLHCENQCGLQYSVGELERG